MYGTDGYCIDPAPPSENGCITWRGGQYDIIKSETRREAVKGDFPIDMSGYPDATAYTDVLKINENITPDDFAIEVPIEDWEQQGYHPMMAIGLGDNSTLLRALKAGNHIASRTWGMFFGWTGDDPKNQLDGTLVFGGYDRAKVYGQGYTQDLAQYGLCGTHMVVTVDDILLHFPNGTDVSIVASTPNGSFDACIVPDYPVMMTIAYDPYMTMFMEVTNTSLSQRTFGLAYYSLLYDEGAEPYDGEMIINIRNGPSIRVPNEQLVVPERYIREEDGQIVANYSRSNLVINSLQEINANDMSTIGRQFLSSAYVMVNQDTGTFTLWSANPSRSEDLVGVDEEGQDVLEWCDSELTPTTSPSETAKPPPEDVGGGGGIPTGAIVGAVIGGLAVVAVGIGAIFWRRRRGRIRAAADPEPQSERYIHPGEVEHSTQQHYYEMDPYGANKPAPNELEGTGTTGPQDSGQEGTSPRNPQPYELTG